MEQFEFQNIAILKMFLAIEPFIIILEKDFAMKQRIIIIFSEQIN